MVKNVSIIVSGKVQGVWFRYFTHKEGIKLELKGFVENLADGRVHINASGEAKNLQSLIKWCHQGSPLSNVERVIVSDSIDMQTDPFYIKS